MAPLAEVFEEVVRLADDLAKESPLVGMRDELLQHDALDAHCSWLAARERTKSFTE